MPQRLIDFLGGLPFFLLNEGKINFNYARIIEGLIIALVTGFIASYVTVAELKVKLAYLEGQNTRVELQLIKTCDKIEALQNKVTSIDALQQERIQRERFR